ncbi:MAG TPA: amino acid permease [Gemmataceae bacterium]|nr:amino acid permease [Gemmataceae bacterium]
MTQPATADKTAPAGLDTEFRRGLGLFDATMVVIGSMIGSGIFIVSADMGRLLGSPGWLLVAWVVTGVLTVTAALSYGELAAMMPRAGGQYVYLREAFSPLCGFLYGWTLFLVIQTGTIAAVGVAFAKFLGAVWPEISQETYLVEPFRVGGNYYLSLSTAQLVGVILIGLLTLTNVFGLQYGKWIQNVFTTAKTGALFVLIVACLLFGWQASTVEVNFHHFWTPRDYEDVEAGVNVTTAFGLLVALCVVQTGSLFSSDAWNNITFAAGEVKEPRRTIPRALALGTATVIALYLLTNVGYLASLPFYAIQQAPEDRVGTAALEAISSGRFGSQVMAAAIMISTFGCVNGLILAGARAYYAMARDGLFFRAAGRLNAAAVPAWGLVLQGVWAALLVLPRTAQRPDLGPAAAGTLGMLGSPGGNAPLLAVTSYAAATQVKYGNLYGDLLDYVISAALIFYILTIVGIFLLRRTRPDAERPYRAFGYPVVPALYVAGAGLILVMLFVFRPATTWPGLVIVLLGLPVYFLWQRRGARSV